MRFSKEGPRVLKMPIMPCIRILPAYPGQVRSRSLRAPEERMVIGKLACLRVLAIAHDLGFEWSHSLGMTIKTPLSLVYVPARKLERRKRLQPFELRIHLRSEHREEHCHNR